MLMQMLTSLKVRARTRNSKGKIMAVTKTAVLRMLGKTMITIRAICWTNWFRNSMLTRMMTEEYR